MNTIQEGLLKRVSSDLINDGCALTSFSELGVTPDEELTSDLCKAVQLDVFDPEARTNVDDIRNMRSMVIARGDETLRLGTEYVRPLMSSLLSSVDPTLGKWSLYAVNRYDEVGATFEPHMDPPGGLVVIAGIIGVRSLGLYRRDPDQQQDRPETFRVIDRYVTLDPGSVFLLDSQSGPPHEVECLEAPSLSAIVDVPDISLR